MKSALISVYDKSNLEVLLGKLGSYRLIATGSSFEYISKLGYDVTRVEDVTGFEEILDGRVKTLHPHIFGGILSRRDAADNATLDRLGVMTIDLVVCNLYPFKEVVGLPDVSEAKVIENIDIGGVSLIRAAAKNFNHTCVLVDPVDYENFDFENRRAYAAKGFKVTCDYDLAISNYFSSGSQRVVDLDSFEQLSYGENRHQGARFLNTCNFEQIQGKELSYNNILDIEATYNLLGDFDECCVSAVKHNTPCGVGFGGSVVEAYRNCYDVDPVSIFGGIVGVRGVVSLELAVLLSEVFLEVVVATGFDGDALELLSKKPNLRLICVSDFTVAVEELRSLSIGYVHQERDVSVIEDEVLDVVSGELDSVELARLVRLQKICKHVKSNAIVIGCEDRLVAISGGQTSRVDAVRYALEKVSGDNLLVASDAFFPFVDGLEFCFENGVKSVIQPGGSISDKKVIEYCKSVNMNMVFTGVRHFRH